MSGPHRAQRRRRLDADRATDPQYGCDPDPVLPPFVGAIPAEVIEDKTTPLFGAFDLAEVTATDIDLSGLDQ